MKPKNNYALAIGFLSSSFAGALAQLTPPTESPTIPTDTTTEIITTVVNNITNICQHSQQSNSESTIPYWGLGVAATVCFATGYVISFFCHRRKKALEVQFHEDIPVVAPPPSPDPEAGLWASRVRPAIGQVPYDTDRVRNWLNSFDEETSMQTAI